MNPEALLTIGALLAIWLALQTPLYILAKRLNTPSPSGAFIPVLCVFTIVRMARLSLWTVLGCLIPYIGVLVMLACWVRILDRLNRSRLWALVIWIPFLNSIPLAVFAYARDHPPAVEELAA